MDVSDVELGLEEEAQDEIETRLDKLAEHRATRLGRQRQRMQSPGLKTQRGEDVKQFIRIKKGPRTSLHVE